MKPWQVAFQLVPRPAAARAGQQAPVAHAWTPDRPLPADFGRRVSAAGLEASADGNSLEVKNHANGESTVHVVVDTRKLDPAFAAALLGLVRAVNGALVRSDGLMIDGTVGSFSKALRSSPAWAHVDDPTGLITGRPAMDDEDAR